MGDPEIDNADIGVEILYRTGRSRYSTMISGPNNFRVWTFFNIGELVHISEFPGSMGGASLLAKRENKENDKFILEIEIATSIQILEKTSYTLNEGAPVLITCADGLTYTLVCLNTNIDTISLHTPSREEEDPVAGYECKFNTRAYNTKEDQGRTKSKEKYVNTSGDAMLVHDDQRNNVQNITPFRTRQIISIMNDDYIGVIENQQCGQGVMKILQLQRIDPLEQEHTVVTYTLEPFRMYALISRAGGEVGIIFFHPPCTNIRIAPQNVTVVKRTQKRTSEQTYLKDFEICTCAIDEKGIKTHNKP